MSKKYTLSTVDWKKIGTGALIAIGGAVLTYSQEVFLSVDFGTWQALAVAINSILVNLARKFLSGYTS